VGRDGVIRGMKRFGLVETMNGLTRCILIQEGLMPFGALADVYHLNWLTEGDKSDKWDVVYWFSDGTILFI